MRFLTLTAFLVFAGGLLAQGKLEEVRDEVDKSSSSTSNSKSDDRCNSDNSVLSDATNSTTTASPSSFGGGGSEGYGFDALAIVFAFPWVLPHMLLDPGLDVKASFQPYPFATSGGAMLFEGKRVASFDDEPKLYSVRATIETGSDFDGLNRVGTKLFLDTDTRFGLKSGWDYYSEKLEGGGRDSLWIGDVMAMYRFVQHERFQMHTGVGARFLLDNGRDRAGINFHYGFDAFPVEPVHLFGSFEGGNLRRAGVWRVQGGIGFHGNHAEIFAGYDYLNIGGVELKGPFAGFRMWF